MKFPLLMAAILTAILANTQLSLAEDAARRSISMTGIGEVTAKPDIAHISLGVVSEAKTAGAALSKNSSAMRKVIDELKAAGLAGKDIQTSGFSVQPQYFYDKKNRRRPREIIGYSVSNRVTATVRDLTRLGTVMDRIVQVGANQMNNIRFAIADPKPLFDEARKRAMEDAIGKASLYTLAAGVKLGAITQIAEGSINYPRPRTVARAAFRQAAEAAVPVEAGEQKMSIRVNVTWTIE